MNTLEGLGARVVPIIYGTDTYTTMKAKMDKAHAVLLTGSSGTGGRAIPDGWTTYTGVERTLWKYAITLND